MIDFPLLFMCFAPMIFWAYKCKCCFFCFDCNQGTGVVTYQLEIIGAVDNFCTDCENLNATYLLVNPMLGDGTCRWFGTTGVVLCTTLHSWVMDTLGPPENDPFQYVSPIVALKPGAVANIQWGGDEVDIEPQPCNWDGLVLELKYQVDLGSGVPCDLSGATATLFEA